MWDFFSSIRRWWYVRMFRKSFIKALCPACSAKDSSIHTVTDGRAVMVEHTCKVCSWVWQHNTLVEIPVNQIIIGKVHPEEEGGIFHDRHQRLPVATGQEINWKA